MRLNRADVRHFKLQRLIRWCVALMIVSSVALAQPKPNLTGTWTGSFASQSPPVGSGDSGPISVTFTQAGTSITGTLTVPGSSCVGSGGAISGVLNRDGSSPSGWSITFGNVAVAGGGPGANAISFTGVIDSATQMHGTFGVHAPCATDSGNWTLFTVSDTLLSVCADCVHAPNFITGNTIPMWNAISPPTLTDSNMTQDASGVINVGPHLHFDPSDGVVQSIGPGSGLFGWDQNGVGPGSGLIGRADGDNGAGVLGRASACTAAAPCTPSAASPNAGFTAGVRGVADGTNGYGVRGFAGSATGATHGVEGRVASKDGHGAEGWNTSTANDGLPIGVFGRTFGAKGIAVSGQATTTADINTDSTIGVLGQAKTGTAGFSGLDQGVGVWGANFSTAGWTRGVLAQIFSPSGEALAVEAPQGGNLIVGRGSPNYAMVFRVSNNGEVHANGGVFPSGADFAESLRVGGKREDYAPGDVLVIDSTSSRQVTRSMKPYSRLVAGIYSTKPGVLASPHGMGNVDSATQVPLAIVGIVPCKVSAENGPIEAGDLLVTASTPGHAMKGTDRGRMLGAVVGKALQPMREGSGLIEVLVTLQ